jgi:hypothetical protein
MEAITLLIAVVALVISILAYQRTGGTAEFKRILESTSSSTDLKKQVEILTAMTDSLRENGGCSRSLREGHSETGKDGIARKGSGKIHA